MGRRPPCVLRSRNSAAFLDDRQVGGEGGVVNLIEAQLLERGDDLAGGRFRPA